MCARCAGWTPSRPTTGGSGSCRFEVFARSQFGARVPDHEAIVRKTGRGVFQRLDNADALFTEHCSCSLSVLTGEDDWGRLQVTFQQRHVLVHQRGIIDEQYVERAPTTRQQVGQALVLDRRDAEQALDAVEALVRALAAAS